MVPTGSDLVIFTEKGVNWGLQAYFYMFLCLSPPFPPALRTFYVMEWNSNQQSMYAHTRKNHWCIVVGHAMWLHRSHRPLRTSRFPFDKLWKRLLVGLKKMLIAIEPHQQLWNRYFLCTIQYQWISEFRGLFCFYEKCCICCIYLENCCSALTHCRN